MRHFSTLVQFRHYRPTNSPLSNQGNAANIWHINEPAIKLCLPLFNPGSQALCLGQLYEENDDVTPGVFTIMVHLGGSTGRGNFFRLQVHDGVEISQI